MDSESCRGHHALVSGLDVRVLRPSPAPPPGRPLVRALVAPKRPQLGKCPAQGGGGLPTLQGGGLPPSSSLLPPVARAGGHGGPQRRGWQRPLQAGRSVAPALLFTWNSLRGFMKGLQPSCGDRAGTMASPTLSSAGQVPAALPPSADKPTARPRRGAGKLRGWSATRPLRPEEPRPLRYDGARV